jgi:hypothetical protein
MSRPRCLPAPTRSSNECARQSWCDPAGASPMSFGGFLGMGAEEHPVPWGKLTYDTNLGGYRTDITEHFHVYRGSSPLARAAAGHRNRSITKRRRNSPRILVRTFPHSSTQNGLGRCYPKQVRGLTPFLGLPKKCVHGPNSSQTAVRIQRGRHDSRASEPHREGAGACSRAPKVPLACVLPVSHAWRL